MRTFITAGTRLLIVGGLNLIVGDAPEGRVLHRGRDAERLVGGTDSPRRKLAGAGVCSHEVCTRLLGQLGRLHIDEDNFLCLIQLIVCLSNIDWEMRQAAS